MTMHAPDPPGAAAPARHTRQSWLSRLLQLFDTSWQAELSALDERALKDLALSRNDLAAIASGAFFADPTRRQRAHKPESTS